MSRGIIVKNILKADNAIAFINDFDFTNIEPFTLILIDWDLKLATYELVWDGVKKHFKPLVQEPKIWSSSPLYTPEMKAEREMWFTNWLENNKKDSLKNILEFHKNNSLGTKETSPKMKRKFVETVSITSIKKEENVEISYIDFNTKNHSF